VNDRSHTRYQRSDDFSGNQLQPVWQWNHVPVDSKWSLAERPGFLRLHALPAADLWHARNTLTQRAIGPRSTVTVIIETGGLKPADVAGLALFNRPYAWLAVESGVLKQFDEFTGQIAQAELRSTRVWLRAECDFLQDTATFRYSTDGRTYASIGQPVKMAYGLITFQGVRYSLFAYNTGVGGGYADFDSIEVKEEPSRPIPYGKKIQLTSTSKLQFGDVDTFTVVDQGLGRVALRTGKGFVSVDQNGTVTRRKGAPGQSETFQWIETFTGEVTLMSLSQNRFLRVDPADGRILADSPGPRPDGRDGVRFVLNMP
jgi:hypothetical protein